MAFNINTFGPGSVSFPVGGADTWCYKSATDNLATINTSGYFNRVNNGNPDTYLDINDLIWIVGSDGGNFSTVTATTPNVVTNQFNATLGAGSVGTANIAANAITSALIAPNAVASADVATNLIQYASVVVSAAEWLGMFAAPKTLLAAPGLNLFHRLNSITYEVNYGGTAFAAGGPFGVQYGVAGALVGTLATATTAAATATGWVADNTLAVAGQVPNSLATTTVNQALSLSNSAGAFTTGNTPVTVHLSYVTLTFTL